MIAERMPLRTLAHALADALAEPPIGDPPDELWLHQSLSQGAAGIAILHTATVNGRHTTSRVDAWLSRAVSAPLTSAARSGLWFGVPAAAFAATIGGPSRYRSALATLDPAVDRLARERLDAARARMKAGARPALDEFDLVRGLTGIGAYLRLRDRDSALLREVLAYLVQLTEPVPADDEAGMTVPGWWVPQPPSLGSPVTEHANLGMAHGICGPLTLLARTMHDGVTVPGHRDAIARITAWLDQWQQPGPAGPWWPKYVTLAETRAGRPDRILPGRPSWCYGTPGITRAQQLAAIAVGEDTRQAAAEDALVRCLRDPAQLDQITDPYLCHGWAGVAATAWCAAADALTPDLAALIPSLADAVTDSTARTPLPQPPGLINGRAGIALILATISATSPSHWLTCLLVN
ncbi:lanthionine synthetase C family protein [Actinoplanes sp. RD1]|uniref:lanthionine synthetase C family protein n=1 Tax=Actinoplanes sp. RD1 TaxID=3064538 RepID=UPI0027409FDC|nr:lanthionine synthetase C family protein [Actinoplanes sp. RD1]